MPDSPAGGEGPTAKLSTALRFSFPARLPRSSDLISWWRYLADLEELLRGGGCVVEFGCAVGAGDVGAERGPGREVNAPEHTVNVIQRAVPVQRVVVEAVHFDCQVDGELEVYSAHVFAPGVSREVSAASGGSVCVRMETGPKCLCSRV